VGVNVPFSLKSTGESYAEYLKRNRENESKAKHCLPENKKVRKDVKESNIFNSKLSDIKNRCFAELDVKNPKHQSEINDAIRLGVMKYSRTGMAFTLNVCEESGVYFFTEDQ